MKFQMGFKVTGVETKATGATVNANTHLVNITDDKTTQKVYFEIFTVI
jgi:hypothetical protein